MKCVANGSNGYYGWYLVVKPDSKVTKVEDAFVEVEIAPNTRVRVVKATLAEVTPLGAKPAND